MTKIVLDNISTLDRLAKINENFQKIEDYINDKVFSRKSEGNPNYMYDSVDFNNKALLNVPIASSPTDPVRKVDMENYLEDEFIPLLESEYGLGDGYNPSIWNAKQDVLVSGVNIKTINGTSLLGSGNISVAGGGGSSDHTLLTNRDVADQHPIASITGLQSALDGKALSSHTHSIANVTGLQTALDGKASTSHTHAISDVTNLQTTLDGKASVSHTHVISDVTGLQTALDGKASTSVATTVANGLMSSTDKSKLDGVAAGATANATDASLRDRSTHTGTQAISTVTGLQTALDGKQALDADLTAIAALSGTGTLQRTGTDTWSLVTNVQRISVGTSAPGDTTMLWLDTN